MVTVASKISEALVGGAFPVVISTLLVNVWRLAVISSMVFNADTAPLNALPILTFAP